ncbi:uncharacterized protein HKW66_Vig0161040 [Vigna angularis]|uniref:KIB1-4 beta-propeller domain-containing protein n=1 Tax=Phaseolus angularis TaxID=3914 RepID=A0A8T0JLB8_PHAAN|nr:uncharacterized protein HKW66_Vig0161040 [Vigna angularis]
MVAVRMTEERSIHPQSLYELEWLFLEKNFLVHKGMGFLVSWFQEAKLISLLQHGTIITKWCSLGFPMRITLSACLYPAILKVEDLGDEMIFLGKCCSTSFYVKELGVGFRNSIYFCNDPITPWRNEWDFSLLKRLGLNRTDVNNWGIFTLGNEDDEPFFFHGRVDMWTDTWFTAPSWWCCRNIPPIQSK